MVFLYLITQMLDVYGQCIKIASNKTEAAVLAMKAGVDMELVIGKNPDQLSYTMDVLEDTILKDKSLMKYVDANVKRIIAAKYRLGMFESAPAISNDMIVESSEEAAAMSHLMLPVMQLFC